MVLSDDESILLNWNETTLVALDAETGKEKWNAHLLSNMSIGEVRAYVSDSVLVISPLGVEMRIRAYDLRTGEMYKGEVVLDAAVFNGSYVGWQSPLLFDSNSNLIVCYSHLHHRSIVCLKESLAECLFGSNVCNIVLH